jgi:dolichol-phosphate mannosyltransferase
MSRALVILPTYNEQENITQIITATAYGTGFRFGLAERFDYILEMDADFSHDPRELANFLREIESYDVVLGSRYIPGGRVDNWSPLRLLLSYSANVYTRAITGIPVRDSTGGFKCFRRKVLEDAATDESVVAR